ncbi:MAG TPA: C1 family peptidase, partial [bacterium]|nr:C1 family peptidase [bacterium]
RPALLLVLAPLLLLLPLSAVSADDPESDVPGPLFGMPNPAAFYCGEMGYDYVIERTPEGEAGVCILPDGRRVDAWEFFRGRVGAEYGYCSRVGLETVSRDRSTGSHTGACAVCMDGDGVEVGTVWELMGLGERMTPLVPAEEVESLRMFSPTHIGTGSRGRDDLPSAFDWFQEGGVTSVKNQGQCGSCWAFSAVAAFESDIKIKDGIAVDLSEQWLVSCNSNGWSCGGGNFAHRYHQWKVDPCGGTGAVLESDFPYAAENLPCDCPYPHEYELDGWGHLDGDEGLPTVEQMKQAIFEHGPIDAAIYADQAFSDYTGGIFRQCEFNWAPNHTVIVVGWDDNLGTEGAWKIKNSWGPWWGEDGYMWLEYGCSYIGFGACWTSYREPLGVTLEEPAPAFLLPGEETSLSVRIEELADTYVPGSGGIYYRYGEGDFDLLPFAPQGGGLYEAVLPPADCLHSPQFYVAAEGERYGAVTLPAGAPDEIYECAVGVPSAVFFDDFEAPQGWSVADGPDLIDGSWERGVPVGGGLRGDPPTDFDGSGSCFVTGNEEGNSDVDGGSTKLVTPLLQFEQADDIVLSYALWYSNDRGNNPNQDVFKLHYLNTQGWLTNFRRIGPMTPTPMGWHVGSAVIGDLVNHEGGFWLFFDAIDSSPWSVVEAGIDAVSVTALTCDPTGVEDGEEAPAEPMLLGASPNPFYGETAIRFEAPARASAELAIYDAAGREVRRFTSSAGEGGVRSVTWDGRDDA